MHINIVCLSHWLLVQHVFVASYLAQQTTHMERDIEPCKQKKCPASSQSSEVISFSFWGNPSIILPYSICCLFDPPNKKLLLKFHDPLVIPRIFHPISGPTFRILVPRSCTVHRWRKLCAVPAPWNSTNLPSASGTFRSHGPCSMENPTPQPL